VPGIYGPRLDGVNTAKIADTDAGAFDGDGAFDRAVGPMQFIPGTWRAMGVDGDGDGVRNPQDIDDAAMSTAVYLCSGKTDLSNASDLNAAVLRYNHSPAVRRPRRQHRQGVRRRQLDRGRQRHRGRRAGCRPGR
jgi:membrane-bound lytic murein transglycosylase B